MIKGFYPISGINTHINRLLRILFSKSQAVTKEFRTIVPTTDTLKANEMAWYKSSAGVIRLYINLEGTIAYVQFTNA